jgi:hypothetical protein
MKKQILLLIILSCFLCFSGRTQQQEMYTFCVGSSYAYLIDTAGTTSNYFKKWTLSSQTSYSAYFQKDTIYQSVSYAVSGSPGMGGNTGKVRKIDWNGNIVWEYAASTSTTQMHHDICPMPNGNVLLIIYEEKSASPTTVGSSSTLTVWSEKIIEVKPNGSTTGTIVWEWHLWDHLCQSAYPSVTSTYVSDVSQHPELMNVNYEMQQDWIHMNGIDYNPTLDQIILSSHYLNEIYVIDHSTTTAEAATHFGGNSGKGGDFLYRWGNPAAYGLSGTGNNSNFHVIHDAHWVPATNPSWPNWMCVYSNQNSMEGGSGTVEVALWQPPYDTINGYVTYAYTPGSIIGPTSCIKPTIPSISASDLGNSQQLDNGNILVTKPSLMGGSGGFYEVNGTGTTYQNVTVGTNHAYRLKKCEVLGLFPTASASASEICLGDVVILNSSATAPAQTNPSYMYEWSSDPSGFNSTSQNPSTSPVSAGTYEYTVSVSSGGCSNTASVAVTVETCSEVEDNVVIENEFNIFPNPTTGLINLDNDSSLNNDFEIIVYNGYGKIIINEKNSKILNLSEYSNGIYYLYVKTEGKIMNKKIILIK